MSRQLQTRCGAELLVKRSRFVAHAIPVESEADTLKVFDQVADPAANHNCWAWRVDGRHRFNDDGEPGGTAGRPILAVLEGRDLDDVMVVVTRFFGGIKLGVGGLIRAYGGAAAQCLDQGHFEEKVLWRRCEIVADFALAGPLHQLIEREGARKLGETFNDQGIRLDLEVPQGRIEPLRTAVNEISRGEARLWLSR